MITFSKYHMLFIYGRNRLATVPENNADNTRKKESHASTKPTKEETEKKSKPCEKKP